MGIYGDENIWIIGASSGIGNALARELAAQGASLILSARSTDKLDALKKDLGGDHMIVPLDVSHAGAVQIAAQNIAAQVQKLDRVIFMAAAYAPGNFLDQDIETSLQTVSVNIGGALNVARAVLPIFRAQGGGQLSLCGSVAGYRGLPGGQPYCATKAAVINLAESLRIEEKPHNIDVKVINPGFVRTPLTDKNDFPMPMMIEPEDAAKAIAKGLHSGTFEIHFPKRFTYIMKFLKCLPIELYFYLMRSVRRS